MAELNDVFAGLLAIMRPYAEKLEVTTDSATSLYLNTRHVQANKKPLFFGAVAIKKNYVSYHLFPVYVDPALLKGLSPALRKRMQGKSCFSFARSDKALFAELAALTRAGFELFRKRGYV